MKNLLKKINVFGLALILFAGIALVSQSAFTASNSGYLTGKQTTENWYYIPDTPPSGAAIYTVGNYTSSVPENCGGSSSVPCRITFTTNTNYSNLTQYLAYQQANGLPVNITSLKDLD